MASNKIEDIIDSIEAYIDECKPAPFSSVNILVNKDELESFLSELRTSTPEVIRQYQRMLRNYENIMAEAQAKSDEMIRKAKAQTDELLSEHQIMKEAYERAEEVVGIASKTAQEKIDRAQEDANNIRMGAIQYTDQLLANVQNIAAQALNAASNYNNVMQQVYETVEQNRVALTASPDIEQPTHAENVMASSSSTKDVKAASNSIDDDLPGLDIPEQFFNKD